MIGLIRGELLLKRPPSLVVDVSGVGYELEAPMSTFYDLPEVGVAVTLHTHFVVREDAQLLYGFTRVEQRDLFRSLLRVNGVGPRVGLAVLSGMTAEEFFQCITEDDTAMLTRVPGIGRKTAERLIVELRDKVTPIDSTAPIGASAGVSNAASPIRDAVSALVALGYKPADATRSIRAFEGQDLDCEQMIREALRGMATANR